MNQTGQNWHDGVFFGLHYDLHAGLKDTSLGKELTHEHLRKHLLRIRPDWIQCDCKGHSGYTSWPTKVGSTSPGVVNDALRIHRDVTRELGIKLGCHYSGVVDRRAIEVHPEWARLDSAGKPDPRVTCRLGVYTENLLIPQLLEVIDTYDVDGFWVDGENWAAIPCWCDRCKKEFTRRTGVTQIPDKSDQPHWNDWLAFHRDLFVEHVTKYTEAVHHRKPDCLVCSNWMYTIRQPDLIRAPIDYLSGDYDFAFGSHRAAVEGRFLANRGMSWDLMAWTFAQNCFWAFPPDQQKQLTTPYVTKTLTHMCQEVSEVLALGGAVMLYDQPQRTGWFTSWHQDLIADTARFCRERRNVCFQSQTASETAILHLRDHYYSCNDPLFNYGPAVMPLEGALHALLETHHSTDILPEDQIPNRLSDYKLIVVPEQTHLNPTLINALEQYARAGGRVLMTGEHLAQEFPAFVGVLDSGTEITEATYLPAENKAVGVSGPWRSVTPAKGTEVWNFRLSEQEPQKNQTNQAVVTHRPRGKGSITAVHGPIFKNYFLGHYPILRSFIRELIHRINIPWTVIINASPRLEVILRQKDNKFLVNLINRGAGETLYSQRVIVEELPAIEDITLLIHRETPPKSVSLVPNETAIEWTFEKGFISVKIPKIHIHNIVIVE